MIIVWITKLCIETERLCLIGWMEEETLTLSTADTAQAMTTGSSAPMIQAASSLVSADDE